MTHLFEKKQEAEQFAAAVGKTAMPSYRSGNRSWEVFIPDGCRRIVTHHTPDTCDVCCWVLKGERLD